MTDGAGRRAGAGFSRQDVHMQPEQSIAAHQLVRGRTGSGLGMV
jgi:hypothetical protein